MFEKRRGRGRGSSPRGRGVFGNSGPVYPTPTQVPQAAASVPPSVARWDATNSNEPLTQSTWVTDFANLPDWNTPTRESKSFPITHDTNLESLDITLVGPGENKSVDLDASDTEYEQKFDGDTPVHIGPLVGSSARSRSVGGNGKRSDTDSRHSQHGVYGGERMRRTRASFGRSWGGFVDLQDKRQHHGAKKWEHDRYCVLAKGILYKFQSNDIDAEAIEVVQVTGALVTKEVSVSGSKRRKAQIRIVAKDETDIVLRASSEVLLEGWLDILQLVCLDSNTIRNLTDRGRAVLLKSLELFMCTAPAEVKADLQDAKEILNTLVL
eukprot:m.345761 g.345761  ORF g.345761 m.345761 type:complete len:324 (-) comp27189_c0_seq1:111-1082(-)